MTLDRRRHSWRESHRRRFSYHVELSEINSSDGQFDHFDFDIESEAGDVLFSVPAPKPVHERGSPPSPLPSPTDPPAPSSPASPASNGANSEAGVVSLSLRTRCCGGCGVGWLADGQKATAMFGGESCGGRGGGAGGRGGGGRLPPPALAV